MRSIVQKQSILFALRIYIAYYSVDYGISKLTGEMFNNISNDILRCELYKVDNFHLTWYWFSRNIYLGYLIGTLQILSGTLILFNRTVIFGAFISLALFLCIFLVDLSATHMLVLTFRVFIYFVISVLILYQYRTQIINAIQMLIGEHKRDRFSVQIIFSIIVLFIIEFVLLKTFNLFFKS